MNGFVPKMLQQSGERSSADRCPRDPEETAEAYVLGRLTPEDAAGFEDDYMTCPRCTAIVEEMTYSFG